MAEVSPWWPHARWEATSPPEIVEAWRRALASARDGRPEAARQQLEALAAEYPEFVPGLSKLAALLAEQGNAAAAAGWLERALALDPNYPPALNNRGNLLLEEGRIAEARELYERALAVDPDYSTARHNLAVALRRSGDISGFVREFKRAQRQRIGEQEAEIRDQRRRAREEGRGGCLPGAAVLVLVPLAAAAAIARWL